MKNLLFTGALLALCATSTCAQTTKTAAPIAAKTPRNVAVLIYDGVEPLDMGGPIDVFNKAGEITEGGYNVYTVGLTHDLVHSQNETFDIKPKFSLDDAPKPDIIIVPGAATERVVTIGHDPRVATWLRRNASPTQTVMSVCTGAFIVGEAGLFDGKDATTHWLLLPQFATQFPLARAYGGVRYIGDGNISSAAGVSSGIDGALHLVEQFSGKKTADSVARVLQYRRDLPVFPDANKARVQGADPSKISALANTTDPICGMQIDPNTSNTATYQGKTYGFCSPETRDKFAANPAKYLTGSAK